MLSFRKCSILQHGIQSFPKNGLVHLYNINIGQFPKFSYTSKPKAIDYKCARKLYTNTLEHNKTLYPFISNVNISEKSKKFSNVFFFMVYSILFNNKLHIEYTYCIENNIYISLSYIDKYYINTTDSKFGLYRRLRGIYVMPYVRLHNSDIDYDSYLWSLCYSQYDNTVSEYINDYYIDYTAIVTGLIFIPDYNGKNLVKQYDIFVMLFDAHLFIY